MSTKKMTTQEFLERLFRCSARSSQRTRDVLMGAEVGLGLGTKPWWPTLLTVWLHDSSKPPDNWQDAETWREAHALVQRLHAEYRAAQQRHAEFLGVDRHKK